MRAGVTGGSIQVGRIASVRIGDRPAGRGEGGEFGGAKRRGKRTRVADGGIYGGIADGDRDRFTAGRVQPARRAHGAAQGHAGIAIANGLSPAQATEGGGDFIDQKAGGYASQAARSGGQGFAGTRSQRLNSAERRGAGSRRHGERAAARKRGVTAADGDIAIGNGGITRSILKLNGNRRGDRGSHGGGGRLGAKDQLAGGRAEQHIQLSGGAGSKVGGVDIHGTGTSATPGIGNL